MSTRVLVLGASGFLGGHVVQHLAASGAFRPVAAWHRTPLPAADGVARVQLDGCDGAALGRALQDVTAVVNCLAGAPDSIARNGSALFAAARAGGAPVRIVQLSSMAVYGSHIGRVAEDAPTPGDVGAYAAAKVAVEQAAAGSADTVVLRPGCIYGPGSSQWSVRIGRLLLAHRIGDLGAGGDGFTNLVHVDDVVAAIVAALRAPAVPGVRAYNLAATPRTRWNEYFVAYARALGAVPVRRISRRHMQLETRLLAPALKVAGILAGRLRVPAHRVPELVPPSLARLWAQEIELDSSRAERELGLRWTPLDRGLAGTVDWLRANRMPGFV